MRPAAALLPLAVRFDPVGGALAARAGAALRDGFDARGKTIRLDLAAGPQAAGAAAWAALAEGTRNLEIEAGDAPAALALAAGAVLRSWSHRVQPRGALQMVTPHATEARAAWPRIAAALVGNLLARSLVALPANVLTPRAFAGRMRLLERHGVAVSVMAPAALRRAGFGALCAVGQAAQSGPYLVTLSLPGEGPPIAFVGKGMCFDTGGISIKPAAGMEAMRADMAGAAACAGAMLSLALRGAGPAVAVLAIAENTTGADAYRPGDVLRSLSGRSIEVIDTDAEGRLALADALHHTIAAHRPRAVVDVATLTGSIVTALGHHHAGLFGNDSALREALLRAARDTGEALWPMPIGASHREDLASDIADIRQCAPAGSGAWGGRLLPDACHAAAFLREFVGDAPWAHLDIAGMDLAEEGHPLAAKGMPTGFGARLLDALV